MGHGVACYAVVDCLLAERGRIVLNNLAALLRIRRGAVRNRLVNLTDAGRKGQSTTGGAAKVVGTRLTCAVRQGCPFEFTEAYVAKPQGFNQSKRLIGTNGGRSVRHGSGCGQRG